MRISESGQLVILYLEECVGQKFTWCGDFKTEYLYPQPTSAPTTSNPTPAPTTSNPTSAPTTPKPTTAPVPTLKPTLGPMKENYYYSNTDLDPEDYYSGDYYRELRKLELEF